MDNRVNLKKFYKFFVSLLILGLLTLTYAHVWLSIYNFQTEKVGIDADFIFKYKGNWLIIALYFGILLLFSIVFGSLKIGYLKMSNIIYSQILTLLCVNFITYFQICLITRMIVDAIPILLLTGIEIIIVTIWAFLAQLSYKKLFPPRNLCIIYGSSLATELVYKMSTRFDKYRICYSMNADSGLDTIKEKIPTFEGVILCDIDSQIRNDILKFCYEKSIRTYVTPKLSDIIIRSAENIDLFDTPILLCRNNGLDLWERAVKRIFDILLSFIAIVIFSPILLIIALAIKIYDKGPVLFKQDRVTKDGKIFEIYKFRSMIVNAEKDGEVIPAIDKDPRITPIGKVIRKLRVDELPQLFNILLGDMSIVGPRPERFEHVEEYSKTIPEFKYRLKVKGGLTGYAQVFGKYNTSAYDKLRLDLMYIQHFSFLLDLKLIIATIKILFIKDSTSGFDIEKSANMGVDIKDNKSK